MHYPDRHPRSGKRRVGGSGTILLLTLALAPGCEDVAGPGKGAEAPHQGNTGTLVVRINTTGLDPDPDGYSLEVGQAVARSVGLNDTVTISGLLPWSNHRLRLQGVAANCEVGGGWNEKDVFLQQTASASFSVACLGKLEIPSELAEVPLLFVVEGRIYLSDAGGSGPTLLGAGWEPSWAPDGRRIAFVRDDGIYLMDADGSNVRRIAPRGSSPAWSPDGNRLAFSSTGGLFVVPINGSAAPARIVDPGHYPAALAWSPDGSTIAFTSADPGPTGWGILDYIYVVNPDGSNLRKMSTGLDSHFSQLAWSPDGSRLALVECMGGCRIVLLHADGTIRPLSGTRGAARPTWSPDGRTIAFATCQGHDCAVSAVTADGTRTRQIFHKGHSPAWRR